MKKLYFILAIAACAFSVNAQNTFPTSGYAGAGTLNPTRPLHAAADISEAPAGTSSQLSVSGASDLTQKLNIGYDVSGHFGFLEAVHENVVWQNLVFQQNGGNVGIGMTTPGVRLTTRSGNNGLPAGSGTSQPSGAFRVEGGDNAVIDFGTNSVNTWLQATDKANLSLLYNINLNPIGGNVGVGTSAPQAKFHVIDGGSSSNATSEYSGNLIVQANTGDRSTTSGASLEFVIPANTAANGGANFWGQARIISVAGNANNSDATGKLILGTRRMFDKGVGTGFTWNYGDDLVIDGAGNTGIGTSNPNGYKLAVAGTIHAQEVKVDMTGWNDYVFKPTYKLPKLSEVKTYIDKNHHLPEMPSEKEVVDEGIKLTEMLKLQQKKIEELTLYVLDQQKQIDELKKKSFRKKLAK